MATVVQPQCDLVIMFATSSEMEALDGAAQAVGASFTKRSAPRLGEYFDLGTVGDYDTIAIRTRMGPFGHRGSAALSLNAMRETGATSLLAVGMAFGVDERTQKIGDVLVSTSIFPYDSRRVFERKRPWNFLRDRIAAVPHELKDLFFPHDDDFSDTRRVPAREELLATLRRAAKTTTDYNVHFGVILSGGARVHSGSFRRRLVAAVPPTGEPVVGGEMEAVGLLAASDPEDPAFVVVKGVSDFADHRRDAIISTTRGPACENAAHFVLNALAREPELRAAAGVP